MSATYSPLVSIVLPTYKRARLLPLAINSVIAQTYPNWELIVVDDNSPDNTSDVVASFTDARIRYVKNNPNLKLPRALNRGFSLAKGEYLTWTSDDNLYSNTAIEKMVSRLETGNCDIVYTDYYLFSEEDSNGQPLDIQHEKLPSKLQLEKGNHIGACFLYTRKVYETVGEYDPELFLVEDYDYFIRIAKKFTFCHIAEPLYYFRRDDDTLFLSRFAEVKASDVLVRYKNDLLDEDGVLDNLVVLLMRNVDGITNKPLRWCNKVARNRSYRLSQIFQRWIQKYLRERLRGPLTKILAEYRHNRSSFGTARDALRKEVGTIGELKYVRR